MQTEQMKKLEENIRRVQDRIASACHRAGRDTAEITLVAVTKAVDTETAALLFEAGVEHIGENRVAEAERKHAVLGDRGTWHMIGHLQRKKVKKALPLFSIIHSVDSIRLLEEISKRCAPADARVDIFLEVNVSGEETKYGFRPEQVFNAARTARDLPGLTLVGLMTMAPYDPDPETARPVFSALKKLLAELNDRTGTGDACRLLSMGMSGDFEVAVEEGATHVRIGTALYEGLEV